TDDRGAPDDVRPQGDIVQSFALSRMARRLPAREPCSRPARMVTYGMTGGGRHEQKYDDHLAADRAWGTALTARSRRPVRWLDGLPVRVGARSPRRPEEGRLPRRRGHRGGG